MSIQRKKGEFDIKVHKMLYEAVANSIPPFFRVPLYTSIFMVYLVVCDLVKSLEEIGFLVCLM